ncbi:uncharacterized protein G2W53_023136 [Senna tora]|uniref:Uncharacterized protein n=1 Tax=Senna tora TaxID=362788 RepID=A0A834WJC0_9FABA|nr:uncharacterized protein G2W53_023136 [Senna tora]
MNAEQCPAQENTVDGGDAISNKVL